MTQQSSKPLTGQEATLLTRLAVGRVGKFRKDELATIAAQLSGEAKKIAQLIISKDIQPSIGDSPAQKAAKSVARHFIVWAERFINEAPLNDGDLTNKGKQNKPDEDEEDPTSFFMR